MADYEEVNQLGGVWLVFNMFLAVKNANSRPILYLFQTLYWFLQ